MAKAKDDLNFRRGDDVQKCQLCANWGPEGKCPILDMVTTPQMVCDGFVSLEGSAGEEEIPAEGQMAGDVSPEMLAAIFGG